ncbi:MotA/TolQ/ExbB proton channel family protein [Planctomycetota bacterium]
MNRRRVLVLLALAVAVAVLLLGPEALAQEEGGPEGESLLKLISYGGFIGYFTIFLSFVGIAFAIEHFINIRRDVLMPPEIVDQVEALFEDGEYEEALQICESQPNYFTRVIANALPMVGTGFENVEQAAARANDDEATKLFGKIGHINFIANVAPMLGLFGTVSGMMFTFAVLANATEPPTPASLAGGIQKAIVTTVIGLTVNIPMSGLFYYFRFRVIAMVTEISSVWRGLLERFREED